jgi:hypothetical protein
MFPKVSWLARWPLALMIGAYAGLRLIGKAEADLVAQVQATIIPHGTSLYYSGIDSIVLLKNLIVFVGVLCVLTYFFFSFELKGPLKSASKIGIITLMITFGASFGFTVMGRVSLLIGRVQSLIKYSGSDYLFGTFISFAVIVAVLIAWEKNNKNLEQEIHA